MKKNLRITALLMLLITAASFAQQPKVEWGPKFDYDVKLEEDAKIVLADNYNHYLFSVANRHGMMSQHTINMRKFDQKNKLVNTFKENFPNKDTYTLYNYLGSYELGKDKMIIFIDSYSNKTKKKDIHRIVFDKNTDTFTSTLIVSYTFESLSKSGTAYVVASQNGRYFGVIYSKFSNRKIAEVDEVTVLDANSLEVAWQKTVTFPLELYSGDMTLTNSGKLVIVKRLVDKSSKHSLLVVDVNGETDKDLGEIKISKPVSITIGTQDYLIALNESAKIRALFYNNIMLYDLDAGRIINNDQIDFFKGINDVQDVRFKYVFVDENQIDVFVECKHQTGTKPSQGSFANDPRFNEAVFSYGQGMIVSMNREGKVLSSAKIVGNDKPFSNDLVDNFGILKYKGDYYINTYAFSKRNNIWVEHGVFNQLVAPKYTTQTQKIRFPDYLYKEGSDDDDDEMVDRPTGQYVGNGTYIHQFVNYFPDTRRLLFAQYYADGKVAFVNYIGAL
ncbi:hypothetical protein [Flavobacterium sp.]